MKCLIGVIVVAWVVYSIHVIFFKDHTRVIELTSDEPVVIQDQTWESTVQPI